MSAKTSVYNNTPSTVKSTISIRGHRYEVERLTSQNWLVVSQQTGKVWQVRGAAGLSAWKAQADAWLAAKAADSARLKAQYGVTDAELDAIDRWLAMPQPVKTDAEKKAEDAARWKDIRESNSRQRRTSKRLKRNGQRLLDILNSRA